MSLKILDATGALRTIKRLSIKDQTGAVRVLKKLNIKDAGGVLRPVFSGVTVGVSPSFITGGDTSGSPIDITTTGSTTATPTGGVPPYTYAWAITDASTPNWYVNAPGSATTAATCQFVVPGGFETANIHCTVTDSIGTIAASGDVACSVSNFG